MKTTNDVGRVSPRAGTSSPAELDHAIGPRVHAAPVEPTMVQTETMHRLVRDGRKLICPRLIEIFLRDWNEMVVRGFASVKRLDVDQYAEISFEDLQADPRQTLRRIVDFFELPGGEEWMDEAVELLVSGKAGRATPTVDEAEQIRALCHPALVLLDREESRPSSGNQFAEPPS